MFANFYRKIDEYGEANIPAYRRLSVYYYVDGKKKGQPKRKSIVESLVLEENCSFEIFVKVIPLSFITSNHESIY